jgi:hypothetical protein
MSHVTIAVGATPPKHQPRQRAGASIQLSTIESRRTQVASAKPTTSRKKKAAEPSAQSQIEPPLGAAE